MLHAVGRHLESSAPVLDVEGDEEALGQVALFELRLVERTEQRPRAVRRQARIPGGRRRADLHAHLIAALGSRPLHRHRHDRAMRVLNELAVDIENELRDVLVHLHRPEVQPQRRPTAAATKEDVLDARGALELRERCSRHRGLLCHRFVAPRLGAGVDQRGQLFLKEVVHQATGSEHLAEVFWQHIAVAGGDQRIAAGDGARAEVGHRPQVLAQVAALRALRLRRARLAQVLDHAAHRLRQPARIALELGGHVAGRRRRATLHRGIDRRQIDIDLVEELERIVERGRSTRRTGRDHATQRLEAIVHDALYALAGHDRLVGVAAEQIFEALARVAHGLGRLTHHVFGTFGRNQRGLLDDRAQEVGER